MQIDDSKYGSRNKRGDWKPYNMKGHWIYRSVYGDRGQKNGPSESLRNLRKTKVLQRAENATLELSESAGKR